MEKLIDGENKNGQRVKLKALFRKQPENKVIIDQLDKYDKANPLDIAVLNYLGQNISEAGIERLNNGENWKSVVITEYMLDIAKQSGNNKLKKNIESLLKNTEFKPEEIGIHALKELEKSLSKKEKRKLKKKLKESKKHEEQLESKIDIYIMPEGKNSFEPRVNIELGNSDKFEVNFYAPGEFNQDIAGFGWRKALDQIEYKKAAKLYLARMEPDDWVDIAFLTMLGILPGVIYYLKKKCSWRNNAKEAESWTSLQSNVKALKLENINWHVHADLKDIYDYAFKGNKLDMSCKDKNVKKMIRWRSDMDEKLKYALKIKKGEQETIMVGGYGG